MLSLAILAGLLGFVPQSAHAEPEVRLRLGTIAPEDTPWADHLSEIKDRIERESNGRIKVTLYLGGRKGDETKLMSLLRQGRLQGAAVSNGAVAADVPAYRVLELPYLFRNSDEADYVIDEVIGEELADQAERSGFIVSVWAENGWRSIASRKSPVHKLEDLALLKVRSQETPTNREFWEAVSTEHVPIPLDEVLVALRTGVINGFDQTPIYMMAAAWHTQVQYFTLTRHAYQPAVLMYNKRFLDGLPDDLRAIVRGDEKAESKRNRIMIREANDALIEELKQSKIEVIELSPEELGRFRTAAATSHAKLRDEAGGELVDKVKKALDAYRAEHE
jgi:TRAP-type C4-dicarboxylate transport system substrate-binding protein